METLSEIVTYRQERGSNSAGEIEKTWRIYSSGLESRFRFHLWRGESECCSEWD